MPFETTTPISDELKIEMWPGEQTENGILIKIDERERLSITCRVSGPYPDLKAIIYKDQVIS